MSRAKALPIVVGVSLFIGVMADSVLPNFLKPVIQMAQPFVCADGEIYTEVGTERWRGETSMDPVHFCEREDGSEERITAAAIIAASAVYSVIAFVLIMLIGWRWLGSRRAKIRHVLAGIHARNVTVTNRTIDMRGAGSATKRDVLAIFRREGLMTEAQYRAKLAEVDAKERREG